MNNKLILGVVVVVLVIGGAFFLMQKPTEVMVNTQETQETNKMTAEENTAGKTVEIKNFKFIEETLTVAVGDTVTWTNQDTAPHSATADDGSFDTGVLSQNQSGSVTFDKPGTYTYFCSVHPNMKGTIIVK